MSSYVAGYFTEKVWHSFNLIFLCWEDSLQSPQKRVRQSAIFSLISAWRLFWQIIEVNFWPAGYLVADLWSLVDGPPGWNIGGYFLIFNFWCFCYRGMDFPSVIIISYSRFAENSPGETQEAKSWSLRTSGHINEFQSIEGDQFTLPTDTLQFNLLEVVNSHFRMFHDHHVDL